MKEFIISWAKNLFLLGSSSEGTAKAAPKIAEVPVEVIMSNILYVGNRFYE